MAKYSKKSQNKVKRAMHEMKEGKLKSGRSGKKVTNPRQAIAIGLSEAREAGAKVPRKGAAKKGAKKGAAKKGAKKRAGRPAKKSGGATRKRGGRATKRSAPKKKSAPKKRGRKRRS
jgi:hypothetical protein